MGNDTETFGGALNLLKQGKKVARLGMENNNNTGACAMRPLTYGEKAVGLTFNPSNDPLVQKVKESYAKVIDLCNKHILDIQATEACTKEDAISQSEKIRLFKIAITEAQTAQMWAVKAITWK